MNEEMEVDDTGGSSDSSSSDESVVFSTAEVFVEYPFPRVITTHAYCCLCFAKTDGLPKVPLKARTQAFKVKKVYIPQNNRCCRSHLLGDRFYELDLARLIPYSNTSSIGASEIAHFMEALSEQTEKPLFDTVRDVDVRDTVKSLHWVILGEYDRIT
jgi:hypothetical protein